MKLNENHNERNEFQIFARNLSSFIHSRNQTFTVVNHADTHTMIQNFSSHKNKNNNNKCHMHTYFLNENIFYI